ncbi:hypothetical protein PU560_02770 [Georgenia sp. 10Sc9-8]|uniref:CcmD family protein n=1 Tax=Georgenia halotolerans TaxID=3028317 RepID=A0ABT5TVV5_9MICO|nr:hypothetical protein [Georgenia halotolerans]
MRSLTMLATASVRPEEFTVYTVTPGLMGFVWFFIFAVAGYLLFRSLVGHMRRVDHNARARREAQEAAARTERAPGRSEPGTTGSPDRAGR